MAQKSQEKKASGPQESGMAFAFDAVAVDSFPFIRS
jgi:hypothetical protein